MRKNVFAFLFVVFSASASFAEAPKLWAIEYGPELSKLETNSLDGHEWLHKVDRVRPNASALSSREVAFSIEGISYNFVRNYEVEGIAGKSIIGFVGNSSFRSVITKDENGRMSAELHIEDGGRPRTFNVIGHNLFEVDTAAVARGLTDDYVEDSNSDRLKVEALKRRAVEVCGEPYLLETTAYLYEQAAVDSWLFEGDEAALRLYLQNVADSITPALQNSKIYELRVRLVRLEKVPTVQNAETIGHLGGWLEANPYTKELLSKGVGTVALWFGVARPNYTGMASVNTRVCLIGGGGTTERHEWGHNHYARHQPEDYAGFGFANNPTAFANAVNTQFATAVALPGLCPNFCGVIPVYSTPLVSYNGIPTGTEDRNNAGVIRQGGLDLGAVQKCAAPIIGVKSVFETKTREE